MNRNNLGQPPQTGKEPGNPEADTKGNIGIVSRVLTLLLVICVLIPACQTTPEVTPWNPAWETPPDLSRLGSGDVIRVSFQGAENLSGDHQIRSDGMITLPFSGESELKASGLTTEELSRAIIDKFGTELAFPEVNVTLIQTLNTIYVTGSVLRPQTIQLLRPMTAFEAVMESGGFVVNRAKMDEVRIIRNNGNTTETIIINLQPALRGTATNPFYLKPFDTVYVPQKAYSLFDPTL